MQLKPNQISRFHELVNDGKTYAQIATEFRMTRSTVSGMIYRMRHRGQVLGESRRRTPTAEGVRVRRHWAVASAPLPAPFNLTTLQLWRLACPFPVGEATGAEQLYCGHSKLREQPYCCGHMQLAYRKETR